MKTRMYCTVLHYSMYYDILYIQDMKDTLKEQTVIWVTRDEEQVFTFTELRSYLKELISDHPVHSIFPSTNFQYPI